MSDETSIPIDTDVELPAPPDRDNSHLFRIGNRFWEARSKHGRDRIFSEPSVLLDSCIEYFNWVDDHPLQEHKVLGSKDGPEPAYVQKMRVMTLNGLCIFLDITQETWRQYAKLKDFSAVCQKAESIIKEYKFAGAAADLLNPAIIARDLGLADKREISGPGGTPIRTITEEMTPNQAAEVWLEILNSEDAPPTQEQIEDMSLAKDKLDLK